MKGIAAATGGGLTVVGSGLIMFNPATGLIAGAAANFLTGHGLQHHAGKAPKDIENASKMIEYIEMLNAVQEMNNKESA